MSKAAYTEDGDGKRIGVSFICPGCDSPHTINMTWEFNGDLENPTISPSIKVTYSPGDWEHPGWICHSFVRNGRIEYCSDSTHSLAGGTVDLPDFAEYFERIDNESGIEVEGSGG